SAAFRGQRHCRRQYRAGQHHWQQLRVSTHPRGSHRILGTRSSSPLPSAGVRALAPLAASGERDARAAPALVAAPEAAAQVRVRALVRNLAQLLSPPWVLAKVPVRVLVPLPTRA